MPVPVPVVSAPAEVAFRARHAKTRVAFVDAARATVSELVESRPEVRAAIDACRKLERAEHAAASQIADDTYAEAQRELASIVRRRIRADEIRVCLEGIGGHPYR